MAQRTKSLHEHSSQALQMPSHKRNVVVRESELIVKTQLKWFRDATEDPVQALLSKADQKGACASKFWLGKWLRESSHDCSVSQGIVSISNFLKTATDKWGFSTLLIKKQNVFYFTYIFLTLNNRHKWMSLVVLPHQKRENRFKLTLTAQRPFLSMNCMRLTSRNLEAFPTMLTLLSQGQQGKF